MCVALDLISAGHGSLSSGKAELERERGTCHTHIYVSRQAPSLSLQISQCVPKSFIYAPSIRERDSGRVGES